MAINSIATYFFYDPNVTFTQASNDQDAFVNEVINFNINLSNLTQGTVEDDDSTLNIQDLDTIGNDNSTPLEGEGVTLNGVFSQIQTFASFDVVIRDQNDEFIVSKLIAYQLSDGTIAFQLPDSEVELMRASGVTGIKSIEIQGLRSFFTNASVTNLATSFIPCFCRGTLIKTSATNKPIEAIRAGDMIATLNHGIQKVRWVGFNKIGAKQLQENPKLLPVRIRKNALAPNYPEKDLLVSRHHRVLVRSKIAYRFTGFHEALIPAFRLLPLPGVDIEDVDYTEYFHIMLDEHEIISSNGMYSESFYPGTTSIETISQAARIELMLLFPNLGTGSPPKKARIFIDGEKGNAFIQRHLENDIPLFNVAPENFEKVTKRLTKRSQFCQIR